MGRDRPTRRPQNAFMDSIGAKEATASFLARQDAQTLAQALLELAEDYAPVYQRLERLRLRDDPAALTARFTLQLQKWETDDRFVRHQDAAAFGRDLDVWVAQVQREVLPRFPGEAMALLAAFLDVDRVDKATACAASSVSKSWPSTRTWPASGRCSRIISRSSVEIGRAHV